MTRSSKSHFRRNCIAVVLAGSALALAQVAGPNVAAAASGNVTVHLSNRSAHGAACKAANVDHIYVTIVDVKAHRSGSGGGFPSLIGNPTPAQFDLLFASDESTEPIGSADCPIVGLGGTGLAPGKYQQVRLITAVNGATNGANPIIPPDENACSSISSTTYNCVDAGGQLSPLTIPSGGNTGLKLPPGQVHLNIAKNQSVDLDIDINACRDLVAHGAHAKGKKGGGSTSYSLKPTLHGGEVTLNPVISGQVVLGADTGAGTAVTPGTTPVPNAAVWLEADQSQSVDVGDPEFDNAKPAVPTNTVVGEATTDANGNFAFCPVPVGSYDIVVDAESLPATGALGLPPVNPPADATITTGVSVVANNGVGGLTIPLIQGSGPSVDLSPQVTTQGTSGVGNGDDIFFAGTQNLNSASPAAQAIIPPYPAIALQPLTTSASGCPSSCPVGTNCVCFDVFMPPDNPVTGAAGGTYTSGSGTANYSLLGNANVIGSSTPACTPSQLITLPGAAPLAQPTLSFTNCD